MVVRKPDRLGRNSLHILETVKALTDRGETLVSGSGFKGGRDGRGETPVKSSANRMLKNPISSSTVDQR